MSLIACGGCTSRWTGIGRAHCSGCHRTFGGLTGFDKHRTKFKCTDPAELGMVENDGVWSREYDPD